MYGCVCAYDTTSVLQSIRFEVPNVEIETLCQRACSCPQLRGGPEQRDFTASCLHGAISPTCAFPPISHLQSRKWELGSIDENERNVFETPQKGPGFVPTIRHHQNEPTDPPIWCWHQHQTKMLVCHLCFREGGQFAWPKKEDSRQMLRMQKRGSNYFIEWIPDNIRSTELDKHMCRCKAGATVTLSGGCLTTPRVRSLTGRCAGTEQGQQRLRQLDPR